MSSETLGDYMLRPFERMASSRHGGTSRGLAIPVERCQVWHDAESDTSILTDRLSYPKRDRVFPVFSDENALLARTAFCHRWRRVIDLGTGSGILAILAAKSGASVCAVDLMPRALAFARANVALNGVSRRVRLMEGDVYEPVIGKRFDLIVSNPPFVALPDTHPFHVAGHGGPRGTRMIEKILIGADRALEESGVLVLTCLSLEQSTGPYVLKLARAILPSRLEVTLYRIYPCSLPIDCFYRPFLTHNATQNWAHELAGAGFVSVGYYLLVATRRKDVPFPRLAPIAISRFSGGWPARLSRYQYWERITQI